MGPYLGPHHPQKPNAKFFSLGTCFPSLAMHHGHMVFVLLQPTLDVGAERLDVVQSRGVVVVEGKVTDSVIELFIVVPSF